ncbi:MAG: OadG family protein [Peptococcaceae bacterium]|nr:OadG family protein [Peptococcaceae bacterium]
MSSELFFYGLKITAIGMGIVFVTLYVTQLILLGLGQIATARAKNMPQPSSADTLPMAEVLSETLTEENPMPSPTANEPSFGVLVAISAALAAMLGSRPVSIISIRKEQNSGSAWQEAARLSNAERHHN